MTPTENPITRTERKPLPEEKLWQKVLSEGVRDREWLKTADFTTICLLAGAHPGYLRRRLRG